MRQLIYIVISILFVLTTGCTKQRDLYTKARPHLLVRSDWQPANMVLPNDGATLLVYNNDKVVNWMDNPNRLELYLQKNSYDLIILNSYLLDGQQQPLDYIEFRGKERFENIEAYATEMANRAKFRAQEGELIVNNPDSLATRSLREREILDDGQYELKYVNGKGNYPTATNYLADTVDFTPCRVTLMCEVVLNVKNADQIQKGVIVKGTLRGFTNSVFLGERLPSHTYASHQFAPNHLKYNEGSTTDGVIYSRFSTFGPPVDDPDRDYELQIDVLYTSAQRSQQFLFNKDNGDIIKQQLLPQIARRAKERVDNEPILSDIRLEVDIALDIEAGNWDVGVEDWGDDIIIVIPFM